MEDVISRLISKETKLKVEDILNFIETPSNSDLGDYSFPCFYLARKLKRNPSEIAEELSEKFKGKDFKGISLIEARNGYLNFFLDRKLSVIGIFKRAYLKDFGRKGLGKGKKFLIEFSQPNTHKAFHVGHIRGTVIGESLSRIFEFEGNQVIRANYSGDTGMHIAKWIWCYQKYHSKENLKNDESWIAGIYVDAVKRLKRNKKLQKEVDKINLDLEEKNNPKMIKLWKKTRKISIESWKEIYNQLNTKFDVHYFESELGLEGKKIAEELLKKKIAKKDDAIFIDLKKYNLGVWVLSRKDGSVLYSAKDLALAHRKLNDFHYSRYLITIADEQRLHFEQLIKTLELMKFPKSSSYEFLPFGMVRFPKGKISSRTGDNVLYSDFYCSTLEIAKKGLIKRGDSEKISNKKAPKIAISAIKYSMLKQDPRRIIIFDPKEAISFEGDTGPYLLYSYARANSILQNVKKHSKKPHKKIEELEISYVDDLENKLLKKVNLFPEVVEKAYENLSPNLIANYCFELSKLFNEFYHSRHVLGSEDQEFRLRIVEVFKIILKKCLDLLGIDVLEEM
tara:strand:- start:9484 stop:11178 length:1695 start_codon:yes stop_codon:yes gene_type:complete